MQPLQRRMATLNVGHTSRPALRCNGATWASIASELNDEDVPTAQCGRYWYPATVRHVVLAAAEVDRRVTERVH